MPETPPPLPNSTPDPIAQPPGSKIMYIPAPDSITLVVPRTGFKGTAFFFLFFSGFWNLITWPLFAVFILSGMIDHSIMGVFEVLFFGVFLAVGVLTAAAAIQFAFRHSVLVAAANELALTSKGPFRTADLAWKSEDLQAIQLGPSGTVINGRPLMEVKIKDKTGKEKGFFEGQDENEQQWIIAILRQFYNLNA